MDANNAKEKVLFGLDSYFGELLGQVDTLNPQSKARPQIEALYRALRDAAEASTPEVPKDEEEAVKSLLAPGACIVYRMSTFKAGAPKDMVAMLVVDLVALPESAKEVIAYIIEKSRAEFRVSGLAAFTLTKGSLVGFQSEMLLLGTNQAGALVTAPHKFHWQVSGKALGGADLGARFDEEAERLNCLLHIVLNENAATLLATNPNRNSNTPLH